MCGIIIQFEGVINSIFVYNTNSMKPPQARHIECQFLKAAMKMEGLIYVYSDTYMCIHIHKCKGLPTNIETNTLHTYVFILQKFIELSRNQYSSCPQNTVFEAIVKRHVLAWCMFHASCIIINSIII